MNRTQNRLNFNRWLAAGMPAIRGGADQNFPFPYDLVNILGGRVRVLYAPTSVAIPTNLDDIFETDGTGYAAKTGWLDLGAAKEGFSYGRSFETSGWEIQQTPGFITEEVTSISRSITASIAEIIPENLALIENAPAANIGTAAAGAGKSSQATLKFGSFTSLTRYRFAFIAQRPTVAGLVTMSAAGGTRGRFFGGCVYEAQVAADEVTLEQTKGELSAASVTFTCFPAAGQAATQEYGIFFDEPVQTIA